MFIHNLKYSLKILLRNRMLIFWTLAFPLILGTFFYLAFSNIENSETFNIIDIAVVKNQALENDFFTKEALTQLSDEKNENRLFSITYVTQEEAKEKLSQKEITGYLYVTEQTTKVVVGQNGVNETILKTVIEEIKENAHVINTLAEEQLGPFGTDYELVYKTIAEKISNIETNIKDITNQNMSYTMIEFYTLIAMACLYCGILGMVSVNQNLANMSKVGKRVSICPTPKKTTILSSVIASYLISIVGLALLFLYTIFVLHVDYGSNLPLIILLSLLGALAGLSIGISISTFLKTSENVKTGIIIAVIMFACFLSGMMGITMKYIIDKNIPILNKINPANMITDGFYALYHYDTTTRYWFNAISLIVFSSLLIILSYRVLRRQKYDSI